MGLLHPKFQNMTQISAKILADSSADFLGVKRRLTTLQITFPRFILAELNTHRALSKNSASSRAIPFNKMVEAVKTDPFIPIAWQLDHKGMQGSSYLEERKVEYAKSAWLVARNRAVEQATYLNEKNVTKQLANRLLEPFMWHTVIVSGTEWENFFALRCPRYEFNGKTFRSKKDAIIEIERVLGESDFNDFSDYTQWATLNKGQAEIHMMALAEVIWDAMNDNTPKELKAGEWHLPFSENFDTKQLVIMAHDKLTKHKPDFSPTAEQTQYEIDSLMIKISVARCARVSYTVVGEEGKPANYENDLKLHDMLAKSGHWSPFEHVAKVMTTDEYFGNVTVHSSDPFIDESFVHNNLAMSTNNAGFGWHGNFQGFTQYRKMFANENLATN